MLELAFYLDLVVRDLFEMLPPHRKSLREDGVLVAGELVAKMCQWICGAREERNNKKQQMCQLSPGGNMLDAYMYTFALHRFHFS